MAEVDGNHTSLKAMSGKKIQNQDFITIFGGKDICSKMIKLSVHLWETRWPHG